MRFATAQQWFLGAGTMAMVYAAMSTPQVSGRVPDDRWEGASAFID